MREELNVTWIEFVQKEYMQIANFVIKAFVYLLFARFATAMDRK